MGRVYTCLAIALAIATDPASAEITEGSTTFSLICKAEHSVGFDYASGSWQQVNFKPSTYVITKLNPEVNKRACMLYLDDHRASEPTLSPPDILSKVPAEFNYFSRIEAGTRLWLLQDKAAGWFRQRDLGHQMFGDLVWR